MRAGSLPLKSIFDCSSDAGGTVSVCADAAPAATSMASAATRAALTIAAETTQVSGVGSPAYMSPEQLQEFALNHQTDIFSLGVVMYQLLTGALPFKATNNYSMVYQIIHVDVPPASMLRPEIPAPVDAIVRRALR